MLAFDRLGSGVPLVFVHAFPLNRRMWTPHLPFFAAHFQAIAFDLPGFGGSPLEGDVATMESMATEIISTLDALQITEKAVFVGCSLGGYVLFQLVRRYSKRIRALGLISTRSQADTDIVRNRRAEAVQLVTREGVMGLFESMKPGLFGSTTLKKSPDLIKQVQEMATQNGELGVTAALRGMAMRPDSTALLPKIECPTLVLSGAEDSLVSPIEMNILAKDIPQAEYHSLPRTGHLLNVEKPADFNSLLLKFLKRHVI